MIEPRSVYELEDECTGEQVFIVAPGPSLEKFPLDVLVGRSVIVVNAAVELLDPVQYRWWLFTDKRFTWLYRKETRRTLGLKLVTREPPAIKLAKYFNGDALYVFNNDPPVKPYSDTHRLWWYYPEEKFLPGHTTVIANALSLACLMNAARVVLVGVDLYFEGDKYYAGNIQKNPGPRNRWNALMVQSRWLRNHIDKHGTWPVELFTVNESLSEKIPAIKYLPARKTRIRTVECT